MRRAGIIVLTLLLGIVVLGALILGAGAIYAANANIAPLVETVASWALRRQVTLERLTLDWGNPVRLELRKLTVANAPWGSRPHMLELEQASAAIAVWKALHGVPYYEELEGSGFTLVLERDENRRGNWKFGEDQTADRNPEKPPQAEGGFSLLPAHRGQFPVLLDFVLRDSFVTYRTSSGDLLRIGLDEVIISAEDADSQTSLKAIGSYKDIPLQLDGSTDPFTVMRDFSQPFDTTFDLTGDELHVGFDGVVNRPLDFDQVEGRIAITADRVAKLVEVFGAQITAAIPLEVTGGLTRNWDDWRLMQARGELAGNVFTGGFSLKEGPVGGGDEIGLDAQFAELQLQPILSGLGPTGDNISLEIDRSPTVPQVDIALDAGLVQYESYRVNQLTLRGAYASGQANLSQLAFVFAGGQAEASGEARAEPDGTAISTQANLAGAQTSLLAGYLGAEAGQIAGSLTSRAALTARGITLDEALKTSRGHVVLAMDDGRISSALLKRISVNLLTLVT